MIPGRNDPCPCGSGKKYKKCCYLTGQNKAVKHYIESPDIQDDDDFYDDDDDYYDEQEQLINAMNNLRRFFLDKKPHIKKYYKIRNIHSEIVNTMIQYHHDGKFKRQIDTDFVSEPEHEKDIYLLECDFDLDTGTGAQAFYDIWIYKMAANMTCITDDFIRDHRYRKPEKIVVFHSMLDSKLGLFEVTGTDMEEGYAYLKDVFTGDEYTIVDIGLSGNPNYDAYYIYTRIITYQDISFGTGLNFIFGKTDNFIKNHIQQHKKDFNLNGEFLRFTQLYNRYSQYPGKVRVITNKF
jgi:hypothetical protein